MKKKIVIAGFGDTGILAAIHLSKAFDIVAVTPKPCHVSGQELGVRVTQPELWKRDYLIEFERYKRLDGVRILQGSVRDVDPQSQTVIIQLKDNSPHMETYDVLLVASGVTNGFWRTNGVENKMAIEQKITKMGALIRGARTIAIVGGGASAVSLAANLKAQSSQKHIYLYYPQDRPLPNYHPKTRTKIYETLTKLNVQLRPKHRANIPRNQPINEPTHQPLSFSTGQPTVNPDITFFIIGNIKPNSRFLPKSMLDEHGFVNVDQHLRVKGYDNIFAVGDIANSDPLRSSARNWGAPLVAHNIQATLKGNPRRMKKYKPSAYRWGSILGLQPNGLHVFQANGNSTRIPRWFANAVLFPHIVAKGIYKGIRSKEYTQG